MASPRSGPDIPRMSDFIPALLPRQPKGMHMVKLPLFLSFSLFLMIMSITVHGQETPKVELFGGYSYLRADDVSSGANMNGWNLSLTGNANSWFGVALDFSGHYRNINDLPFGTAVVNTHILAVGPQFAVRSSDRMTPFAHIMFGVGRSGFRSQTISGSFEGVHYSVLGVMGGGVDLKIGNRLGYRLIQGDYILTHFAGRLEHQLRFSTGLVLRGGEVR